MINIDIRNLIVRFLRSFEKFDLKNLIDFTASFLTIVAFFIAIDFFTSKPSINITTNENPIRGFSIPSIQNYYDEKNYSFPSELYKESSLDKLFNFTIFSGIGKGWSPISLTYDELVDYLITGKNNSWFPTERLKVIEEQIGNERYIGKRVDLYSGGSFVTEKKFETKLKLIKSILSEKEALIFYVALVRSRVAENYIKINNDGEIDFKNVEITIPAPRSIITESREGNFLSLKPELKCKMLNKFIVKKDSLIIKLPSFKRGESLSLLVYTKENAIQKNAIFHTQEMNYFHDKKKDYLTIFLTAYILSILLKYFIFRGNKYD